MIEFYSQTDFELESSAGLRSWLAEVASVYNRSLGELGYVFCDDNQLLDLNRKYLSHDTLTDIITFNYNLHNEINGEVYVSVERVRENAGAFSETFTDELHRVMVHGLLHLCGLDDETKDDKKAMREAEDEALRMRNFL